VIAIAARLNLKIKKPARDYRQELFRRRPGRVLWDMLPDGKQLGGAPANFAYMTSLLGDEGIVVSRVGSDALGRAAGRASNVSACALLISNLIALILLEQSRSASIPLASPPSRLPIGSLGFL